jgi:sigma-B regulation protein RsbU (phosphoserine phosphatase)
LLNPKKGTFAYSNAGHNPPIWLSARTGEAQYLSVHGIALGVVADARLTEQSITLDGGDVLALYTDGVTEALNGHEEEFGVERLEQIIRANIDRSADDTVGAIDVAIAAFVGDELPFDDLTLVILKRNMTSPTGMLRDDE